MSKAKDIILFSGSSNPKLGAKITKYLSLKKGEIALVDHHKTLSS